MRRTLSTVAACAALVGWAGCGGGDDSSSKPKAAAPAGGSTSAASAAKIPIQDFKFVPQTVTVKTGAKVTWVNKDSAPHTAQTEAEGFDTGTLNKGESKTVTLSKPGTYKYFCVFHRFMTGTITVR